MSRAQLGAWKEKGEVRGWGSAGAPGAGALRWDGLAWPGTARHSLAVARRSWTGRALGRPWKRLRWG